MESKQAPATHVTADDKVVAAPSAQIANNSVSSFLSNNIIQIIIGVALIGSIIYIIFQLKNLNEKVNIVGKHIVDQDSTIDRHEKVLKKIMILLTNKQSSKNIMDTISEVDDESVTESVKTPAHQDTRTATNTGGDLTSLLSSIVFPLMAGGFGTSVPAMVIPQPYQEIPSSSIEELDSEIKEEMGELSSP